MMYKRGVTCRGSRVQYQAVNSRQPSNMCSPTIRYVNRCDTNKIRSKGIRFFYSSTDVLSNWSLSTFHVDGRYFNSVEQYVMAKKAEMFGDVENYRLIRDEALPWRCHQLGRLVRNFNPNVWIYHCYNIMYTAVQAKFQQNPEMLEELLNTHDDLLAQASPWDYRWGIGCRTDKPGAFDSRLWRGTNWLGKMLMRVREELRRTTPPPCSVDVAKDNQACQTDACPTVDEAANPYPYPEC